MREEYLKNAALSNKDQIAYPFNILLDIIGFDGIKTLSYELSGANLYIPSLQNIFKYCIQNQIPKEFDGKNYKQLCFRYGISERTVRTIVDGSHKN